MLSRALNFSPPLPTLALLNTVVQSAVSQELTFSVTPASETVSAYATRLASEVFAHATAEPAPPGALSSVNVKITDVNVPLQLGVDESYTLLVPADGTPATITANTVYGAYMALQTLFQAIRFDFDLQQYGIAAAPLSITDAPKFAWRGILIDTDRHWLSLRDIHRIIDAMGYAKLNILHWHIVDWQAWPLQSTAYPALWGAAWSSRERYTLTDVSNVIAYANARGIRVVPEFDTCVQRSACDRTLAYQTLTVPTPPPCPAAALAMLRRCATATRTSAARRRAAIGPVAQVPTTRPSRPSRTPRAATFLSTPSRLC
jgi:N-acetyl-beta-hexosaminidase